MTVNEAIELLTEFRNRGCGQSRLYYLADAGDTHSFNGCEWTSADVIQEKPNGSQRAVVII